MDIRCCLAALMFLSLASVAWGGALEDGFRKPPAELEPGVSTEASGDLAALKLRSDADCMKGTNTVTCNRAWPYAKELVDYVARCRYLLKAGDPASKDGVAVLGTTASVPFVCRAYEDGTVGYFLSFPMNGVRSTVRLSFEKADKYPELWDPLTGRIVQPERREVRDGHCIVFWRAEPGASLFVMMRPSKGKAKKVPKVEDSHVQKIDVKGAWEPSLPSGRTDAGAVYRLKEGLVSLPDYPVAVWLDLGETKGVVEVKANGKSLGTLWAPPYRVELADLLKFAEDRHTIEPGAVVGQEAPVEVELKVTGVLGAPKWEAALN